MFKFCTYTFLTVLAVDLLATSGDVTLTWTSPILPKLYSNNTNVNPLGRPITQDEESWIGSLINIGAIFGPAPFGFLSRKIGRKVSLLCLSIPYIVSFAILALIQNIYWYYFARLIAGISLGAGYTLLPLYIAEIAEDSNRGRLSATLNIFWTLGNLIPYVLGPYMTGLWFNATLACIPALFFVVFLVMAPETPYYLVSKNKIGQAEESLMRLRSRSRSAVRKEITHITWTLRQDKTGNFTDLFKWRSNLKALAISLCLISFQQLSGIKAVMFYTQLIFEVSGSDIPPEISSIIIGLVLFLSTLITPFFADTLGRRPFLIISSLGMMASLALLGAYFYLKEIMSVEIGSFSWVPILCIVLFIVAFNFGFGPLLWTVSVELFSVGVKPIGVALVSSACWSLGFVVTRFFKDKNMALSKAGTFWVFSGFCFIATLFTWFCVPETRGKSFREIQEILEK